MLLLSISLLLAAFGLEIYLASQGIFRVLHWETLPLVGGSLVLAALAFAKRRTKARGLWMGAAVLLSGFYAWATLIAPLLPERSAAPERLAAFAVLDAEGNPETWPAAMTGDRALLVFFRGAW